MGPTLIGDPGGIHGHEEPEGSRRAACPCLHALHKLVRMHRRSGASRFENEPHEQFRSSSHDDAVTSFLGNLPPSPHLNDSG